MSVVAHVSGGPKFDTFAEDGTNLGPINFEADIRFTVSRGTEPPPNTDYFALVTNPEMIAIIETRHAFDGRDRRRIRRELRKALQRVRAGTYVFEEPPPDAPIYET